MRRFTAQLDTSSPRSHLNWVFPALVRRARETAPGGISTPRDTCGSSVFRVSFAREERSESVFRILLGPEGPRCDAREGI